MDPALKEALWDLLGIFCMGLMGGILVSMLINQWKQLRHDWKHRNDDRL